MAAVDGRSLKHPERGFHPRLAPVLGACLPISLPGLCLPPAPGLGFCRRRIFLRGLCHGQHPPYISNSGLSLGAVPEFILPVLSEAMAVLLLAHLFRYSQPDCQT